VLLERSLVSLYGERLRKLGYDAAPGRYAADAAEQQLLRRQLIGLVASSGRDPAVRGALVPFAEHSVGDPAAVEPLFRWRVWAVGVQERGTPVFSPLRELLLNSEDVQVRQDAGLALACAEEPGIAREALELVLDPKVDPRLGFQIVTTQLADPRAREVAWQWFGAHRDAALARMPAIFQTVYAQIGKDFCSGAGRDSFNQVLGTKLRALQGGEIAVDRVLESIDSCSALRATLGDSVSVTLTRALN
jgi:hypothetical protein